MKVKPEFNTSRLDELKRMVVAALGGLLLTCAFPQTGIDVLVWVALVPIFIAIIGVPRWSRFRIGIAAGLAHYLSLLYWVVHAMNIYGQIPIYWCIPLLILLTLYLALYIGIFALLLPLVLRQPFIGIFAVPAVWVSLEYLRSHLFTGFTWGLLGHTQSERIAVIQLASFIGVYGISWLIVMANSVLTVLYIYLIKSRFYDRKLKLKTVLGASAVWAVLFMMVIAYGQYRIMKVSREIDSLPAINTAIVQGNISQAIKWDAEFRDETTMKYINLSLTAKTNKPDLVIWPETALPFYFTHDRPTLWVLQSVKDMGTAFVIGGPSYTKNDDGTKDYYNSAFLINGQGEVTGRYDKAHLVPYGEYVPLRRYMPFINTLVAQIGDFSKGEIGATHQLNGIQLGILICYEMIFPYISRAAVKHEAELLINITNDAWYGWTSAPYQHFAQAVFRAVESKRYLVRSANTGISGVIDPLGRVTKQSDLFVEDVLIQPVKLFQGKTIYHRFGDVFAQINAVLALLLIIITIYQRRTSCLTN